jgi:ribose transport system permease protein
MDLQAHYQTFFTGVVVLGAVLLDIYRNQKASEVKILTKADTYKNSMQEKIDSVKLELSAAMAEKDQSKADSLKKEILSLKRELKKTYIKMKSEERTGEIRLREAERVSEREFHHDQKEHQTARDGN